MFEAIQQLFQNTEAIEQTQQATQPIQSINELQQGDFYTIPSEHGGYQVLKLLKTDDNGVHIRLYSNVYPTLPQHIDISDLFMAGFEDKTDDVPLGMGHLPIGYDSFMTWEAVKLNQSEPVVDDELEGYNMWQEAEGGYF